MKSMNLLTAIKSPSALGGALLITGCCIGAGMIALPVVSALAGFIPSSIAMLLCYIFTTITGLFLLEATLWFDEKVNLFSIAEYALGKTGKILTGGLFLFLFYCLFVAYFDAGGQLFKDLLSFIFNQPISDNIGILACAAFVGSITYSGTHKVDKLNRFLMVGLILSYCILVSFGVPKVSTDHLSHTNLIAAIATIPILLISFGYQNLVPSLTYYLKRNIQHIRFAIIIGNFIPLLVYLLWNFIILGILPSTPAALEHTNMISELLQNASQSTNVMFFIKSFSLFAILTSFLPSAISFIDFIRDGLKHPYTISRKKELLLFNVVFLPPLICSLINPHIFLQTLGFAGGFIDVLLFGVLPALIILIGRYIKKATGPYQVKGGSYTPIIILLVSIIILFFKLR